MSNKAYHRTHCKVCGDEITDGTQFSTCSNHRRGWNKRELPTCPCGKPAENIRSKYCGEEHRKKWGIKPPVAMITHTCQACGNDFERPHFYPGKKMFCSLKCSNIQHSRKRAQHYRFGKVVLNGSYELRFIACMLRFNIDWAPWPDDRPFVRDGHEYRPDFLVNGRAIEVKGWEPEDHPQRAMRAAWDLSEPLVVIDEDALKLLEVGCNAHDILTPLNS
jgi:predicted nucleic acid-binding Zn ribbon protein